MTDQHDIEAITRLKSDPDFQRFVAMVRAQMDAAAQTAATADHDIHVRRAQGGYRFGENLLKTIDGAGRPPAPPRQGRKFT